MSDATAVLRVEGITVVKGKFVARDISFTVGAGECFVILGPSGTGKTTVVEAIAGINRPRAGAIYIDGAPITHLPPERRNIAYVPQDYALFPHMTVRENLTAACHIRRIPAPEVERRLARVTGMLQIKHLLNRHPKQLSSGEQQRVALGRALMIQPKVLLLDEPLSALDTSTQKIVRTQMRHVIRSLHITSVIVTHDYVDAFTLGDRIAVMEDGRIVQMGTPQELLLSPRSEFVAEFVGVNFLQGVVDGVSEDGRQIVRLPDCDVVMKCHAEHTGDVLLTFFPTDVQLSLSEPSGIDATANVLRGQIYEVIHMGDRVRVGLLTPAPIVAELNSRDICISELTEGAEVYAIVPIDAIRVYK